MLSEAISLAKQGIAVFPLKPRTKVPHGFYCPNGVKDATKDLGQIEKWWSECPRANVGIALGEVSGIAAVDFDHKTKKISYQEVQAFLKRLGVNRTVVVHTRHGYHLYFKYTADIKNGFKFQESLNGTPSATWRADGYYTVAPGSIVSHDDGEWEYSFTSDAAGSLRFDELTPASISQNGANIGLSVRAKEHVEQKNTHDTANRAGYMPGDRHDMFRRTAISMRRAGSDGEVIKTELLKRNDEDCTPPKENAADEINKIISWVMENIHPEAQLNISEPDESGDYLKPLGYRGDDYFYTSSSNKNVVRLTSGQHGSSGLQALMPPSYWKAKFGNDEGKVSWTYAGGVLMAMCRWAGYFDESTIHGQGFWRSDKGIVIGVGKDVLNDPRQGHLAEEATKLAK